jgi:hypothetical protein
MGQTSEIPAGVEGGHIQRLQRQNVSLERRRDVPAHDST